MYSELSVLNFQVITNLIGFYFSMFYWSKAQGTPEPTGQPWSAACFVK